MTLPFRTTDPVHSIQAAPDRAHVSRGQEAVYECLRLFSPLTDEKLIEKYALWRLHHVWPMQSPSGIRSRRAELVRLGLVVADGEGRTAAGRKCSKWRVA